MKIESRDSPNGSLCAEGADAVAGQALDELGSDGRRRLQSRLRRSIRELGLAYAHRIDPESVQESLGWDLDPAPRIFSAEEWELLEIGIAQRARLTNAFLRDIYRSQRILKEGLVPPEIILDDPYYRRPCIGLDTGPHPHAVLLRFDLVRQHPGDPWKVLETQANTPVGLTFAVQNRRFLTQEFPEVYARLPDFHSVVNFPLDFLETLGRLSPRPQPSVVVLTSGPRDPWYVEHSFLARKMGLPLAQGEDLLVLDNTVYFKTIAGLERVDVIYRRLNDSHIDPVVLATARDLAGVPGLLQCVRHGTVALANAIGTGVGENRALQHFHPKLSRFYLSERLILRDVPCWHCGDVDQMEYLSDRKDEYRIEPIHASMPKATPARIRRFPHHFVGRPKIASFRQTGPVRSRFSAFALCVDSDVRVFPGGLWTEAGRSGFPTGIGRTRDVVVCRGSGGTGIGESEEALPGALRRQTLGSRGAENLFWLGRHLERAANTARMLALIEDVGLEEIPRRDREAWFPIWEGIVEATGQEERQWSPTRPPFDPADRWKMTFSREDPASIVSSIEAACVNARRTREVVSPECWMVLQRLQIRLNELERKDARRRHLRPEAIDAALQAALCEIACFFGLAEDNLLHDAAWRFLRIGVHLERAVMTCSALRHVLSALLADPDRSNDIHSAELSALLRMLGSQDAYRRLYQARTEPRHVAELLLRHPQAPRGVRFCMQRIRTNLAELALEGAPADHASFCVDEILAAAEAAANDPEPGRRLETLLENLNRFGDILGDHYLNHQARLAPSPSADQIPLPI